MQKGKLLSFFSEKVEAKENKIITKKKLSSNSIKMKVDLMKSTQQREE
jgi:hypothetical protein